MNFQTLLGLSGISLLLSAILFSILIFFRIKKTTAYSLSALFLSCPLYPYLTLH